MEALMAVAIAFAAFVGLALVGFLGFAGWRYYVVMRDIDRQLKLMNSSINGVPVLLNGIKDICGELAKNTLSLGGSVNVLKKSLIDETSDPRRPGVIQYDDEAADRAYQRQIIEQNEALLSEEGNRFIIGE